jgi:glycosyltransferase involved in cell wall biosynthesis
MPLSDAFVSVVAPLQDDADIVEAFADDVLEVLAATYTNYELILVDDGSRDATLASVERILQKHRCVRYVRLSRRFGREIAVAAGLDTVIGDFTVVMLPASDPPALVPELVRRARSSGVVCGVRTDHGGEPLWARLGARAFYAIAGACRIELPKHGTLFQALSRQAVNGVTRMKDKYRSLRLLSAAVGYGNETLPYEPIARRPARRHRGFLDSLSLAVGLVVSSSTQPLRFVSGLGLAASTLNLLYILYVVAIFFLKENVAEGWTTTSLQLSSMFFFLFLIMTVLTEYVGRILDEAKDRPLYHVIEERNSNVAVADAERRNVVKESIVG